MIIPRGPKAFSLWSQIHGWTPPWPWDSPAPRISPGLRAWQYLVGVLTMVIVFVPDSRGYMAFFNGGDPNLMTNLVGGFNPIISPGRGEKKTFETTTWPRCTLVTIQHIYRYPETNILLMVQKSQTTTWDVEKTMNTRISNYYINWCRISFINSIQYPPQTRDRFIRKWIIWSNHWFSGEMLVFAGGAGIHRDVQETSSSFQTILGRGHV